jgi:6-phosphogluconolactonase
VRRAPEPDVEVAADAAAAARALVRRVALLAEDALAARGRFSLALSGGRSIQPAYELLAERRELDWTRVEIFWGDERAVPPGHPESNYRLAAESLLARVPVPPHAVHRMPADWSDLDTAARAYESLLIDRLGTPPRCDLVLLGLGEDAHTASLFPHQAALRERTRFVVSTPAPAIAPRLTFTYATLGAARHVLFFVTGAHKAAAVRRTLHGPHDPETVPAQGVAPEGGAVAWVLDRAAAAGLRRG